MSQMRHRFSVCPKTAYLYPFLSDPPFSLVVDILYKNGYNKNTDVILRKFFFCVIG